MAEIQNISKDAVIIGGGPAGLAAAVELHKKGITDILILEREKNLGGILRQCIHDGFGLIRFKELLSGPEYAGRFISQVHELHIPYSINTSVIQITPDHQVTAVSPAGLIHIQAKAIILTMGCRERTRGALQIPGERPCGVLTAGVAQAYMNLYNRTIGKNIVILGSGDIGLIMARRLTLEGAHVHAVYEIQSTPSGLQRNIHQCLNDFGIPLYLSHTVTNIHGNGRISGVTVQKVDNAMRPVPGTEQDIACDTLILSVGLIPENELSVGCGIKLDVRTKGAVVDEFFQTSVPGVFAAGNVLHVHDLVDNVSQEAEELSDAAAQFIRQGTLPPCPVQVCYDEHINHVLPQYLTGNNKTMLSLRVGKEYKDKTISVIQNGKEIAAKKMKRLLPAEMIRIPVSSESFVGQEPVEVCII